MHYKLPAYISAHAVAFVGVAALHGVLMAWQLLPSPPVVLPQQQIIQISMVAPSAPVVTPPPPTVPQAVPEVVVPPKAEGMKKVQPPKPQPPAVKAPEPPKEQESLPEQPPAPFAETSGVQAAEATVLNAAVTEPIAADYLRNPPPVYPRNALRKRMQGIVMIEVRVSSHGLPMRVALERSSGYAMLDEAALEAVRKWKFVPARRGSEVMEASVVVPVEFRIN